MTEYWDKVYGEKRYAFGLPSQIVEILLKHVSSGTVLDIGAGQGRNSIFLAERGFQVTAIDSSEVGIKQLQESAKEKALPIKASVKDIREFTFTDDFDVLIAQLILQYLSPDEALQVITKMQAHTAPKGYNIITVVTRESDDFRELPSVRGHFYPQDGELKKLYANWQIVEYRNRKMSALRKREDGSQVINTIEEMIARKPL